MIQGLGTDSRGWALQRLAFGRRYRCYTLDNRGTGRSDRPAGPYSLERMALDAARRARRRGCGPGPRGRRVDGRRDRPDHRRPPPATGPARSSSPAPRAATTTWRRELLQEWADAVDEGGMAALGDEALEWLVGPRLRKRFGIWLNLLARIVLQPPPEPFIAQVGAILDATDDLRLELVNDPRAHARDHRLAGLAHAGRRRRGARRADPARPPRGARRRRARAHGRGAERVQRRGAALPRSRSTASTPPSTSPPPSPPDPQLVSGRLTCRQGHAETPRNGRRSGCGRLAIAGDEVVDEAAHAGDDLGVEALGGGEHLVGAGRLVPGRVERGVDRAVVDGREAPRLLDLVVVELAPEQRRAGPGVRSSARITGSV